MSENKLPRKQCAKCPWKVSTDPHDIPGGYCETKHEALAGTVAEPANLASLGGDLLAMACHESHPGSELPCVGWLENQLGAGNNLVLRMAALTGQIDADVDTVGEQHQRLEDTLPQ